MTAALVPVMLERSFDRRIDPAAVGAMAQDATPWFCAHGATWRRSYLAADGRHLLCWYDAPDARALRAAVRRAGWEARRLWPGTEHPAAAPPPGPEQVAVERRFTEPVTVDAVQALEDAGAWCLDAHRVRFVRTFFSADRRRMICLYSAPDAESVRTAQQRIGMPLSRVWACTAIEPDAASR